VKAGAVIWGQYTEWPGLRDAAARADALGYDSLWTWDHLYPIVGSADGPIFEGYMILAGWAAVTSRATLGLMVGANTFRNPGLVVKTVTTLDHQSEGRAVLGVGGAWFEPEHRAFGLDFGSGDGERLDRLDEAVELMRRLLAGEVASARGRHYHARAARNDPRPVQPWLPILIGGGGERKTLATVARYADAWNLAGSDSMGRPVTLEQVRHKDMVLRRWCDEVGRDEGEIERVLGAPAIVIRDDENEARRVARAIGERHGGSAGPPLTGSPAHIAEYLAPYVELGFRHVYIGVPAPFDAETLERFVREVKPLLDAA
jgi:alkanesulfonate monooxygenase SsuD/methylene tetrahydromethanopterin reductase-like flavin-dependent oxidoreductase (luciferase family)